VHFGLESASGDSNFGTVHKIISKVHKTLRFRWRKLQNGGIVLSCSDIIFPVGAQAPNFQSTYGSVPMILVHSGSVLVLNCPLVIHRLIVYHTIHSGDTVATVCSV